MYCVAYEGNCWGEKSTAVQTGGNDPKWRTSERGKRPWMVELVKYLDKNIWTGLLLIFAMWNVLQVEWLHNFETVNALSELWKLEWWIYPEIWVMLPLSGHIFVDTSYHEAADILCYNCNFLGYHIMSDFQYRVFKKMKMPLNRTILLLKHTHGSWLF